MSRSKLVLLLTAVSFFVFLFLSADLLKNHGSKLLTEDTSKTIEKFPVVKVIDGDTIEVEINGEVERVRYIGIDTPELSHEGSPEECFAREATEINKDLVLGKQVRLEKDVSETDKYDRLLRYVYVDDVFVSETLVESGAAKAKRYYPDTKMSDQLEMVEVKAREAKLGVWSEVCLVD